MPPIALLILWIAWIAQAILSTMQLRRFGKLFRKVDRPYLEQFRPRAWVIVPFKGIDADLAAGVRGLCEQAYPDFRLRLVVESENDPAYAVLQQEIARFPQRDIAVIVAGIAEKNQSQKTHNQLFVLKHIDSELHENDALVFADSDAVVDDQWLSAMVGPLGWTKITAVTTGYRWLVPTEPQTIWSQLASVMNSSVACMLGKDQWNHVWGGSMALLVGTAKQGDLCGRLTGVMTDDYPMTRLADDLRKRVYFVPRCLVATPVDFSLASLWNFGHRQYLITRVYAPKIYFTALAFTSLYLLGFVSSVVCLFNSTTWPWALGSLAIVLFFNALRGRVRGKIIARALGQNVAEKLSRTHLWDVWGTPVWMTLHFLLVLRGGLGRRMTWRGIRYELRGPQNVRRLN